MLYAHTPQPGGDDWHLLVDHLTAVAAYAREFAAPFGAGDVAYYLGLWHDIGKAAPAFQAYLHACHTGSTNRRRGPDHKAAGALLAAQHAPFLTLLIQGHHGGLKTRSDLKQWLGEQRRDNPDLDTVIETMRGLLPEIKPTVRPPIPMYVKTEESTEMFLRMLFSALVDADFLDTEQHWHRERATLRESPVSLTTLGEQFQADQERQGQCEDTPVNHMRQMFYQECLAAAERPPGLFRLAIPTGGGKTRSGMGFALRHALWHNLRRVIVVVPYISITQQTAQVYRTIFESESENQQVVLEHHSGLVPLTMIRNGLA